MKFNIWCELSSFIFLLLVLIQFSLTRKFPNRKNKHFVFYLFAAGIDIGTNIVSSIFISYPTAIPLWLNYLASQIFYLAQFALTFALFNYIRLICGFMNRRYNRKFLPFFIFSGLCAAAILTNPWTHWFFYFDQNLEYCRNTGLPILIIATAVNLFGAWFLSFRKRKEIGGIYSLSLGLLIFLVYGFTLIQTFYPHMLLSGISISMGTILIYLNLQNPQDQKDPMTKAYSRNVFIEYLEECLTNHRNYPIVFFDIRHTSAFNKTFGETNGNLMIRGIAQLLIQQSNHNLVFRYTGDSFMIVIRDRESVAQINARIQKLLQSSIEIGNIEFDVSLNGFIFTQLREMTSIHELINILEFAIEKCKENPGKPLLVTSETIQMANRHAQIQRALSDALENETITVLLQPIYDVKRRQFLYAEALSRIEDSELGTLMPGEFIPIAEKSGQIGRLCTQVLKKACEYLGKLPKGKKPPFDCISVNLSMADCLNPKLADDIIYILEVFGTDPARLILEITETMATVSPVLADNMVKLKKIGIKFACDDFGTGYANLDLISKLPFTSAKLGKSIISLISNEKERKIITQMTKLLKELGMRTVAEGIEDEETARLATEAGSDFLQGFFYSKPIALDPMVTFLNDRYVP